MEKVSSEDYDSILQSLSEPMFQDVFFNDDTVLLDQDITSSPVKYDEVVVEPEIDYEKISLGDQLPLPSYTKDDVEINLETLLNPHHTPDEIQKILNQPSEIFAEELNGILDNFLDSDLAKEIKMVRRLIYIYIQN